MTKVFKDSDIDRIYFDYPWKYKLSFENGAWNVKVYDEDGEMYYEGLVQGNNKMESEGIIKIFWDIKRLEKKSSPRKPLISF